MLEYNNGYSLFHKLHPLSKIYAVILISAFILLSTNVLYEIALFLISFILVVASRNTKFSLRLIKFLLPLTGFLVVFHGFMNPLYVGNQINGAMFGIAISLRMLSIAMTISFLASTTRPGDIVDSLARIIPWRVAFVLGIALRFFPLVEDDIKNVKIAQSVRGARFDGLKILRSYPSIIIPVLNKSMLRSETLALSLEMRGFGEKPVVNRKKKPMWLDALFILVVTIACLLSFLLVAGYYPV